MATGSTPQPQSGRMLVTPSCGTDCSISRARVVDMDRADGPIFGTRSGWPDVCRALCRVVEVR
jgi:hypothetical protein